MKAVLINTAARCVAYYGQVRSKFRWLGAGRLNNQAII
jgi:hypothetical protein